MFETTEKRWIHPVRLLGACLTEGAHFNGYQNVGNDFGKRMRLYPFGEQPRTGNQCCFLLDQGLSPTRETEFYFEIRTEYEVTRNPAGEGFLPLAKWKWEFYGAGGWRELPLEQDETYVFLQSGCLRFRVPEEMAEEETLHVYQIRVTLLEQELDVAPLIENVYLNEIPIRQQYSVCDYEEGEVDFSGEPVQEETFLCTATCIWPRGDRRNFIWRQGKDGSCLGNCGGRRPGKKESGFGFPGLCGPGDVSGTGWPPLKKKRRKNGFRERETVLPIN